MVSCWTCDAAAPSTVMMSFQSWYDAMQVVNSECNGLLREGDDTSRRVSLQGLEKSRPALTRLDVRNL